MVQFVEYKTHIYKVLFESGDLTWVISYERPAAPFPVQKDALSRSEIPGDYIDESIPSAKRTATMEKRQNIIDELIQDESCIYDVGHRNLVVRKIAKRNSLSEKTILRWYYAYLAKGKRGLLPAARVHETVEAPEEVGMRRAISRYYYSPVKMSLRAAYEMYLMDECRTESGCLREDRPPFSKFKSVYNRIRSDYRKVISRQGIGEFQKNYRPLLGQAADVAPFCGHFEMDATSADIELVSKYSRQSVGRPYVYLAVDVFSRMIAGFYVDFKLSNEAVLMCMHSMLQDKAEFARKRGITISPDSWPSTGLPCEIYFDKGGDFMGERIRELCDLFRIEITNLPSYRPDLKGCVEHAFSEVQGMYMKLLHGYGTYEKVNTRLGTRSEHTPPCLDIDEYINILIRCISDYNSSAVLNGVRTPEMIAEQVPPVPTQIWNWMLRKERVKVVQGNNQDLSLMLLPRSSAASITRRGLIFKGLRYHTELIDMTNDYVSAGINGRKKVNIAYNPLCTDYIYLLRNGRYIRFHLLDRMTYAGLSFQEVDIIRSEENEIRKSLMAVKDEHAVERNALIQDIIRKAKNTGK